MRSLLTVAPTLVCCACFSWATCIAAETTPTPSAAQANELATQLGELPGGVCVVLGRRDAGLAIAISRNSRFVVHGLYRDRAGLDRARKAIRSGGLYGRVSADLAPADRLPYAENLVNLVVADDYAALKSKGFSVDELLRVLSPLGVALIGHSDAAGGSRPAWVAGLRSELAAAGIAEVELVEENGLWLKLKKPWPKDIDQWTHFLHGPDGNPVADDRVVGPPKHYQWTAGPRWLRSHDTDSSISAVVTAAGRIYYIVDEAPISLPGDHALPDKWFLAARDAFNGVLLWKLPIEHWGWREWKPSWFLCRPGDIPLNLEMRLVAAGNELFATLGYRAPVSRLDGKTGKVLNTYRDTEGTREILHHDGVLLLTLPAAKGKLPAKLTALDARTGRRLWETENTYHGTTTDYIRWKAMRGSVTPAVLDPALNPATDGKIVTLIDGKDIVCLDFKTGKETWRTTVPKEQTALWMGAMIVKEGIVVYASQTQLVGLSAQDGRILWTQPKTHLGHLWYEWKDVFVIDGLVWTYSAQVEHGQYGRNRTRSPVSVNGYDLHTGRLKRKVPLGGIFKTHHHHRCYRAKATVRYILASRRGTEYVDLVGGHHTVDNWVRGACHFGMLPANGLQYAPPHPCRCYILEKINGFNALAPQIPAKYANKPPNPPPRLEKGPAYGRPAGNEAGPGDWPTFRHDALRSGATPSGIPAKLELLWNQKLATRLSAPVVVGDKVFVAAVDEHHLAALDSKNGKRLWKFCAGARIDSPPTYYRGTLLFGSADGWVYCVAASDGQLAWRFRAAPQDRRIGSFGQLESAWPVHGSVLALGGRAYFAAGRSSHLDGGIHLYALDPAGGKVLHHAAIKGPCYTVENITTNYGLPEGTLADILAGDDELLYMHGYSFNHQLLERKINTSQLGARGGFLDGSYFQRAYWSIGNRSNFARLIVHDAGSAYMVRMFDRIRALDPKHYFTPGAKGYAILAQDRENLQPRWSVRVPVRVRTMVLAGSRLVTSGPPDVVDPQDPLGAFEGRKGGVLNVFSAESGQQLSQCKLDWPPVFNGAAVAGGKLYVTLENGSLSCYATR